MRLPAGFAVIVMLLISQTAATATTAATVGGFAYRAVNWPDRIRHVASAPSGYPRTWRERVRGLVAMRDRDTDFSSFVRQSLLRSRADYYRQQDDEVCRSFDRCSQAGSLEIGFELLAASPDLVSVRLLVSEYIAGSPHPNLDSLKTFIWSRRLHRPLRQADVFAVPPDRALRLIAQRQFDHPDRLQNPNDPNGIPLAWDRATVEPNGISWSFGPYELGGYASSGTATIGWRELRPYLRHDLPFEVGLIRSAPAAPSL